MATKSVISSIINIVINSIIRDETDPTPNTDILLQEDGVSAILQEDGSNILLE